MFLYHGTNAAISQISLSRCKLRTDFGKGFYFSDKIGTAQKWAKDRTDVRRTGLPTLLRYIVDFERLKSLRGKRFPNEATVEWLDFIGLNRAFNKRNAVNKEPRHDYDWVSGPIADDKMNDVVEEYLAGDINASEAICRAKTLEHTFQLSIHTPLAVACVDDENVHYRQLKGVRWLPLDPNWSKR